MDMKRERFSVRELTYIALFAVVITVCAWITIPYAVPFTMQTFAVFAALGLLGGKCGTMAILVYILLGAVGLPVFSGFRGGFGVLLGQTGGYIIGFLASGLLYRLLEKRLGGRLWGKAVMMVMGLLVCYAFGTVWFMRVYTASSGPVGLMTVLGWCVFPFILPDLLKLGLALLLTEELKKHVRLESAA